MRKRTDTQWRSLIQRQQASGLTAEKFCRRHGVSATYFSLRKRQLGLATPIPSASPFISINCTEPAMPLAALTPRINAYSLQFSTLPSADWLAGLIKAAP